MRSLRKPASLLARRSPPTGGRRLLLEPGRPAESAKLLYELKRRGGFGLGLGGAPGGSTRYGEFGIGGMPGGGTASLFVFEGPQSIFRLLMEELMDPSSDATVDIPPCVVVVLLLILFLLRGSVGREGAAAAAAPPACVEGENNDCEP